MLQAIIWDYDGTLVDTRRKNLEVTKAIMREVTGNSTDDFPVLQSLDRYQQANENSENWRELYKNYFHLSDQAIDRAGAMWKEYQMKDNTEVSMFDGISSVLDELSHYGHGIVSQNAHENILSFLSKNQLQNHFPKVVGYEEIGYDQQKPNPTGLLACISSLTDSESGSVIYIGDHETDTQCAHLANQQLREENRGLNVHSIAALYGSSENTQNWEFKPDFSVQHPNEILSIISDFAD